MDLSGVGKNLQDRYEVSVVNRMRDDWQMVARTKFAKGDAHYREWEAGRKGIYTTNGGVLRRRMICDSQRLSVHLGFLVD